jgi:hypothetical protein
VNGDGKVDIILYDSATGTEYTGISNGNGTFSYTYQYWGIGKVLARWGAVKCQKGANSNVWTGMPAAQILWSSPSASQI